MMKDPFKNIDDQIHGIIDENKDIIDLQWQKAQLVNKYCDKCKKDLDSYKEGLGEKIMPGEYIVMMSILSENVGENSFTCYECLESSSSLLKLDCCGHPSKCTCDHCELKHSPSSEKGTK